jgi:hypothetical protein
LLGRYSYPLPSKGKDLYREHYIEAPLTPGIQGKGENKKRQVSSIQILRSLLTFIYDNREQVSCLEDGIINFRPENTELRLELFKYRVALINTLQWESLRWKKTLLNAKGIDFPMELKPLPGVR